MLSTDDEGVSRSQLTEEFERAVLTYNLSYADLKELVRNSIEYSFAPGRELLERSQVRASAAAPCAAGERPRRAAIISKRTKKRGSRRISKSDSRLSKGTKELRD